MVDDLHGSCRGSGVGGGLWGGVGIRGVRYVWIMSLLSELRTHPVLLRRCCRVCAGGRSGEGKNKDT